MVKVSRLVSRLLLVAVAALLLVGCSGGAADGGQSPSVAQVQATSTPPTPPTNTALPPTHTALPPTAVPAPPTDTLLPPTNTNVPPTDTSVPNTNTPLPPTYTKVPPTSTRPRPTRTPLPPTHTPLPLPTATPNVASGIPGYRSSLDNNRGPAPLISSDTWINAGPYSPAQLRGHVVIVEFWTFECINCIHALPGLKAVYDKYHDAGLIVIGDHAPEFSSERDIGNVRQAVKDANIPWAVAIDNDFKNWNAYHNGYWPAFYIIDKQGNIRSVRIGEGNDAGLMSDVEDLLKEQY